MTIPEVALAIAFVGVAWVGHACMFTAVLNNLYGRPIPKPLLKAYRYATGVAILAFPLLPLSVGTVALDVASVGPWGTVVLSYGCLCLFFGGVVFPIITVGRLLDTPCPAILDQRTEIVDYLAMIGPAIYGSGSWKWAVHLPLNDCFRVEYSNQTIAVRNLPAAWDGVTILFVSDLHVYGSPGRQYFDAVAAKLAAEPPADLVVLGGDYLDDDNLYDWLGPVLRQFPATSGKYAVLGNHDGDHDAPRMRTELAAAGYTVLDNRWQALTLRSETGIIVGHEGPWFRPAPDLTDAPADQFRICVSHTPDNFAWGQANRIGLMLCGHVHGGQIRVPIIGSIFVPSIYGRRYDQGTFAANGTVMVISRGLSGKEPIRYRCLPQVIRVTLRRERTELG